MPTTWSSFALRTETLNEAWTGTLTMQNLHNTPSYEKPIETMSVGGIGCLAGITLYHYEAGGPAAPVPDGGWPAEAQAEVNAFATWYTGLAGPPSPGWNYWLFRFYVTAPGPTMAQHFICMGHYVNVGVLTTYGASSYAAPYTMGATNLRLKSRGGDSTPTTRQRRDFIDQHVLDAWHITDTTVSSVTMTVPASPYETKGDITAQGTWGSMPGLGQLTGAWPITLQASYVIAYGANTAINLDYALIAPAWKGVDLDLWALDAYDDGGGFDDWWNGSIFQSPWPVGTPIYRVYGTDGTGIRARRVGGLVTDTMSWSGTSGVPYVARFVVQSGQFDTGGGDW